MIAIDIDPIKIDYARHNAAVYGVDERIDFINGDSFSLAPKLKVGFFYSINMNYRTNSFYILGIFIYLFILLENGVCLLEYEAV